MELNYNVDNEALPKQRRRSHAGININTIREFASSNRPIAEVKNFSGEAKIKAISLHDAARRYNSEHDSRISISRRGDKIFLLNLPLIPSGTEEVSQ